MYTLPPFTLKVSIILAVLLGPFSIVSSDSHILLNNNNNGNDTIGNNKIANISVNGTNLKSQHFNCEDKDWSQIFQQKLGENSIECVSKSPIKWMFTNTWRLLSAKVRNASPLKIHSEMKKCNDKDFTLKDINADKKENANNVSVAEVTMEYYFRSVLDLENLVKAEQLSSTELFTFIGCGDYSSNFGLRENERRIWMLKKTSKGNFEISNYFVGRWDLSPFYSIPEPVRLRLSNDKVTGKCTCQNMEGNVPALSPSFLQCNKLDNCELLMEKQFNGQGRRGKLENFCNSFSLRDLSLQLDLKRPGLLYCNNGNSNNKDDVAYVPYIHTRGSLRILSSNASLYGPFLNMTFMNPDTVYPSGIVIFYCSGPKFLFIKELRWELSTVNQSHIQNFSFHPIETEEKVISSKLTVQLHPNIYGVNLTVICQAAVRNSPEIVQSRLSIITEQKPQVNESIRCSGNVGRKFEYHCESEHGTTLRWQDEDGQDISSDSAQVRNNSLILGKCPQKRILCIVSKNGVSESKQFSPFDCLQFLMMSNVCAAPSIKTPFGYAEHERRSSSSVETEKRGKAPTFSTTAVQASGNSDNVLLSLVLYIRDMNGKVTGTISGNFTEFSGLITKLPD